MDGREDWSERSGRSEQEAAGTGREMCQRLERAKGVDQCGREVGTWTGPSDDRSAAQPIANRGQNGRHVEEHATCTHYSARFAASACL